MNDTIERLADGTLVFLPERLNRDPAVLRGLTNDEMWVALGTGAAIGLLLGVPLGIVTSSIAVAPTSMIASMALVLFAGGTLCVGPNGLAPRPGCTASSNGYSPAVGAWGAEV